MFFPFRKGHNAAVARWAVLWDVFADAPRPVGLAVEHPGHVHVYVPSSYSVPSHFAGEYRVLQPDGSLVSYRPGDEQYFQQVLANLSHAFSVGHVGEREDLGNVDQLRNLYAVEVLLPQLHAKSGSYRPRRQTSVDVPTYRPRREVRPSAGRFPPSGLPSAA
jgi:hypothetical protein